MIGTVGFLELNSIACGIEAADVILKTAQVDLVFAKPVCPGKYNILFTGEVSAVQSSLEAGISIGKSSVIDSTVIPRVHPQVIEAMNQVSEVRSKGALGVLEFFSIAAAVYGADAAVKAANVSLVDVRLGIGLGGKSFVIMTGDVSAVSAAVAAGGREAQKNGVFVSQAVIPNPRPEILNSLI